MQKIYHLLSITEAEQNMGGAVAKRFKMLGGFLMASPVFVLLLLWLVLS